MSSEAERLLQQLKEREETVWINPYCESVRPMSDMAGDSFIKVRAAQARWMRFMPYLAAAFPETAEKKGLIESELIPVPNLKDALSETGEGTFGTVFLKDDAHLPIAGSVKARGGIYEVLKHAEELAMKEHLIRPGESYEKMAEPAFRDFFSRYSIQVGSTGNLGLSIGIAASRLGFQTYVHMSRDAKAWKKDLLRQSGVTVLEYEGDYGKAVAEGRKKSQEDPYSYFIDDERSADLFFGYSAAALRLKIQLYKVGITVDEDHPLFVYLPCGVGGAPGGITYGLKQMYGDAVHCFFAEPTGAPCFTYAMGCRAAEPSEIAGLGLDGRTVADGLAVGKASAYVCEKMKPLAAGSYTISDERILEYEKLLWETEKIFVEPSAAAGVFGIDRMWSTPEGAKYLKDKELQERMENATHVIWATGGGMVPEQIRKELIGDR